MAGNRSTGVRTESTQGSRRASGHAARLLAFDRQPRMPEISRRRARLLLCLYALLIPLGVALAIIGSIVGGVVLLVIGAGALVANWSISSPKRLVQHLGSREIDPIADARLINVVEGLCIANGLPVPTMRVLEDRAANAIVLGRSARDAVLICTEGLLELLDRMEIEGIVAHELAHIKRNDLAVRTEATLAVGVLSACFPFGEKALRSLVGIDREVGADVDGVGMTRYPPSLGSALSKLESADCRPKGLRPSTERLTAPYWCVPLGPVSARSSTTGEWDLSARVALLAEL